ncbi:MAG: exodeoxyribonuclease VII small subunit [Dehalococcoidia bacterium]
MDNHEDLTFERLMSDLEKCVMQLDEGGISLDKAAQIYEEAMKFASLASSRLSDAEIKITSIKEKYKKSIDSDT